MAHAKRKGLFFSGFHNSAGINFINLSQLKINVNENQTTTEECATNIGISTVFGTDNNSLSDTQSENNICLANISE